MQRKFAEFVDGAPLAKPAPHPPAGPSSPEAGRTLHVSYAAALTATPPASPSAPTLQTLGGLPAEQPAVQASPGDAGRDVSSRGQYAGTALRQQAAPVVARPPARSGGGGEAALALDALRAGGGRGHPAPPPPWAAGSRSRGGGGLPGGARSPLADRGSGEKKQKVAHHPDGAAEPAAPLGTGPDVEGTLTRELTQAVERLVAEGVLPAAAYPPPRISQPSGKQRKQLGEDVAYTTAVGHGVAAAARKAAGVTAGGLSADACGTALAQAVNARWGTRHVPRMLGFGGRTPFV